MEALIQQSVSTPVLSLARYRLLFRSSAEQRLPEYAGSAWRGVFGHALKRLVCVTRAPQCPPCLLYRSCVYPYLFETPTDSAGSKLRKYPSAPHPYLLTPGPERGTIAAGAAVSLGLTLFGSGLRQLPYVIHALSQAGERGLGKAGIALALQSVEQQTAGGDWQEIYRPGGELRALDALQPPLPQCPERIGIQLLTPLRVKRERHFATPERFDFAALFSGVLRRISLLMAFHGNAELDIDFGALSRAARSVRLASSELFWREYKRYSNRQQSEMQMGGIVGRIELNGAGLEPFWPYLWLGQWTHAGKLTTMGFGRYRIQAGKLAGPDAL